MNIRTQLHRQSLRAHRSVIWIAAFALLSFCLSGLLHPLMTWTGPRAATYIPPQSNFSPAELNSVPRILKENQIEAAHLIKLVPSAQGNLLQVTTSTMQPRRYFSLSNYQELPLQDEQQARWLASHYSGRSTNEIANVSLQTEFDDAYPWVNRLLPVYRVQFLDSTSDTTNGDGNGTLTLYLYTELNALAGMTNIWRTSLQRAFAWLHTWSWLDNINAVRVIFMLSLLSSLGIMTLAGITLLVAARKRKIQSTVRRWHRRTGGLVSLLLLAFISSGSWHLIQYADAADKQALQTVPAFSLSTLINPSEEEDELIDKSKQDNAGGPTLPNANSISLILGPEKKLYYRLGLPQEKRSPSSAKTHDHHIAGISTERPAIYIDAITHEKAPLTDEILVTYLANANHSSARQAAPIHTQKLDSFGNGYDFRNKRLPVWRLDYASGESIFMDPVTGMRVETIQQSARAESWVFSNLHKWNGLTPISGRGIRDLLMVLCITLIVGLMLGGIWLRLTAKS